MSAKTNFICCNCNYENQIEIVPYSSGFPIFQIYNEDSVLTKKELLDNKIVTEKQVDDLYNYIIEELNKYQDKYDFDTDFGRNDKIQKYWSEKICSILKLKR